MKKISLNAIFAITLSGFCIVASACGNTGSVMDTQQIEQEKEPQTEPASKETEQDFKDSCIDVTYEDLARNPEKYTEQNVHCVASIGYIYGDYDENQLIGCSASISQDEYGHWNYVTEEIYLLVHVLDDGTRILSEDTIELWGVYQGLSDDTGFVVSSNSVPYIIGLYWNFVE